jgi:GTP-binding nuclear protein Ran
MKMCFSKPAGRVVLKLWDMAGQEKLSGLGEGYYVGADAAIVVWETGFTLSYEKCLPYIEGIKRMCGNIPIILVQTKVDLTAPPIQSQCPALKAYPSFAISTKLNQGIRDPLEYVADMLVCPKDDL